ncbi:MAG: UDP-N-acetylmuramoyl-L-alanine--D-glutamate ligase [Clostridiales bacterium]|jgi:UDP-N-acetylmuramoylalanine--D-glutamate ligase|nr:UDP-N-acetylmuramoyl-L-alanine--D-glutamate ligase [Clostridiales bacterium]
MDLKGKKVVVIGLARSGAASARLLAEDGAEVVVNDRKPAAELTEEMDALRDFPAVTLVAGSHPAEIVDSSVALVIKNPGVPLDLPPIVRATELGIPVITEVELAAWKISAPIVAITGTNGKTTTTALTGEMYKNSGRRTFVAGNIGLPLSAIARSVTPQDVVVAELSSFQLEGTLSFRPSLSAILNITPDHMDRHGTLDDYREAKAKIFANQKDDDAVVLNADDTETYGMRLRPAATVYTFSRMKEVPQGAYVRDGQIIINNGTEIQRVCAISDIAIPGAHNLENALAATLLAWLGGVPLGTIADTLRQFPGVPHRLEFVQTVNGISFYNDSKGTNTDAAIKAMEAFAGRKVLIAGGYDKGGEFESFAEALKEHASHVVIIGQVAARLASALTAVGFTHFEYAGSLDEAVRKSYRAAKAGEIVLLSPACASWDMFRDFEERGDQFKDAVLQLEGRGDETNS